MPETEKTRLNAVTGATRVLAIVGDPIIHAKSPVFYNARLAAAGTDAILIPIHAPERNFDAVMSGLLGTGNVDGIVITYPFKQQAMHFATRLEPMAERIGALNALRRDDDGGWTGGMFDGFGLLKATAAIGKDVIGSRVKLFGAGGAGGAIAHALADGGAVTLSIFDRDKSRLSELKADLGKFYPDCEVEIGSSALGDCDLLINATPVGLSPNDGLLVALPDLAPAVTVIDIVPRPSTPLLDYARERGCRCGGGASMVEGQADLVLAFFNLRPADSAPLRSGDASGRAA